MVGHPFEFQGEKINYSTGNPMGFYSSWASFALAHHYLIYYICRVLNIEYKTLDYALLGDDLVICNKQVADMYKDLIRQLGVDYSPSKTYESAHFFEFAKRLFYKGNEISPFPLAGLSEVCNKYYLFIDFLNQLKSKG